MSLKKSFVLLTVFFLIITLLLKQNPISASVFVTEILTQQSNHNGFFTENKGQWDPSILFMGNTDFGRVALTKDGVLYQKIKVTETTYETQTIKQTFVNPTPIEVKCDDALSHYNNYFIGNDPTKWASYCRNFAEVTFENVWEGIDISFFFTNHGFHYGYHIEPFAKIGHLTVKVEGGDLWFPDFNRNIPEESDRGLASNSLVYSTFLSGGNSIEDCAEDISVDDKGCAYVTGQTTCPDFPISPGATQIRYMGGGDTFITKLNPDGTDIVYSTFLGGESSDRLEGQNIHSIAIDKEGCAYVTCYTSSAYFPTTEGAFQSKRKGVGDAFVAKLSMDGAKLVYSTYLGGSGNDCTFGIAVDDEGSAAVCGFTISRFNDLNNFPVTIGAFQENEMGVGDGFLTKLSPDGTKLIYSTYLGGCFDDYAQDIVLDSAGNAYVCLWTFSTDFVVSQDAYQKSYIDNGDIVLLKLKISPSGTSSLAYSTYLGGPSHDKPFAIAVDHESNVYVTGLTSNLEFPTTKNAFQSYRKGLTDAFVTKLNPTGTDLIYSTYLGGSDWDCGYDILVDDKGCAFVTGMTKMNHFPTTPSAFQSTNKGCSDVFLTKLNSLGTETVYSSYMGGVGADCCFGISMDKAGDIYLAGSTSAVYNTNFINDFPITKGAFQSMRKGDGSAFVTKFKLH